VQVTTGDALSDRLTSIAVGVADTLGISYSEAELLCAQFKWDVDLVVQGYLHDMHGLREKCGLSRVPGETVTLPDSGECSVCLGPMEEGDILGLWCGHRFCRNCWTGHITATEEPPCMATDCPARLSSVDVLNLTGDQSLAAAFKLKQSKKFILLSKNVGTCKNVKGCPGVLMYGSDQSSVTCGKCKQTYCARCEMPPHSPTGCDLMKTWHSKGGYVELSTDEMAALELLLKTTKPCPKCGVRIEKNQGCPHMTCRHCRYEFCWECRGKYHTTGTCSNPEEKGVAGSGTPLEMEAANKACADASKRAKDIQKVIDALALQLETGTSTMLEKDAEKVIESLKVCQSVTRLVAHGYVLAFFMNGGLLRQRLEFTAAHLKSNLDKCLGLLMPASGALSVYPGLAASIVGVLKSESTAFEQFGQFCGSLASLQAEEKHKKELADLAIKQAQLAAESALLSTAHRALTFHVGSEGPGIALTDGNTAMRRGTSYHAIAFSDAPLTQPTYFEVEITERESSWSGHIEIGLCARRERSDSSNLSGVPIEAVYMKPHSGSVYRGSSSSEIDPRPTPVQEAVLNPGFRMGILYAHNSMTMYFRQPGDGYLPQRFAQVPVSFSSPPYAVINLYGQTRAVRFVNPSA